MAKTEEIDVRRVYEDAIQSICIILGFFLKEVDPLIRSLIIGKLAAMYFEVDKDPIMRRENERARVIIEEKMKTLTENLTFQERCHLVAFLTGFNNPLDFSTVENIVNICDKGKK
jgi:hypothetical protein